MGLALQGASRPFAVVPASPPGSAGYIMVVLLVAMAVSAVGMAAALPSWRHQVLREREAELVFRGEAIARAIYLYRQKNGQALPPNLDILVSQRYLRKKYVDPITNKDFLVVGGATAAAGAGGSPQGGVIGVRSTSNDISVLIYNNQQIYSQWAFDFTVEQMRSGVAVAPSPAGRGRQTAPGELNPITPARGRAGSVGTGQRGQMGTPAGRGQTGPPGGGLGLPTPPGGRFQQ